MTCEHALDAMLDADLPDVISDAVSPLGVHVSGCARCRRVANQLMVDTRLLANAVVVATPVRRRVSIRTVAFVPAAVAAALLVMVTLRQQSPVSVRQTAVTLPALLVEPVAPTLPDASAAPTQRSAAPQQLRAFPRAQPMVAAKLAAAVAIDSPVVSNAVTVTPLAGTTALVMHTSDPKLVVVWLY